MNLSKGGFRKIVSAIIAVTMFASSFTTFVHAEDYNAEQTNEGNIQAQFYVAVTGDDKNDGSQSKPFATVEKARQAVDAINDSMTGNIVVNVGAGDYYLDQTIEFGISDSGSNGYEIIYQSSDGLGNARLIGGKKINSSWELADEGDVTDFDLDSSMVGKVYKTQLDKDKFNFNTLYINGNRAEMARTLNREDNERFFQADDEYMYAPGGSRDSIAFPQDKLPQSAIDGINNALARGEEGAQVYGWDADYRNWFTSTIPVAAISGIVI